MRQLIGKTTIYALRDPHNGQVRYVGRTRHPKDRERQHVHDKVVSNTPCGRWLAELRGNSVLPEFVILETMSSESQQKTREAKYKWIAHYRSKGEAELNVFPLQSSQRHWLSKKD